jgi:hypothetical protein
MAHRLTCGDFQARFDCGDRDIFFDLEETKRHYDFDAGVLTLVNEFRGPCAPARRELRC